MRGEGNGPSKKYSDGALTFALVEQCNQPSLVRKSVVRADRQSRHAKVPAEVCQVCKRGWKL